jgi:hypothetical protein
VTQSPQEAATVFNTGSPSLTEATATGRGRRTHWQAGTGTLTGS